METPVMTSTALKSSTVTTAKIALWILLKFSYDLCRKPDISHLRFSLAYSVGVQPVILLKEIPK